MTKSCYTTAPQQAMQAMFQLIMQEGWSEVMSEAMCHRPEWFLINIYFILLHLFASLVGPRKEGREERESEREKEEEKQEGVERERE